MHENFLKCESESFIDIHDVNTDFLLIAEILRYRSFKLLLRLSTVVLIKKSPTKQERTFPTFSSLLSSMFFVGEGVKIFHQ